MSDGGSDRSLADELNLPNASRSLRDLPGLAAGAVRLVWSAARPLLLLTVALQVIRGALLGVQVIASRYLLEQILRSSTSAVLHKAAPWLIVLVVVYAALSLLAVLQLEFQRLLSELVSRYSMDMVIDAALEADLVSYEDPYFHDRLQRAIVNATLRPLQMTTGLLTVGAALLSAAAVAVALVTLEPWLLVVAAVSLAPVTLVSVGVGRALYRFAVEQTPYERQRYYLQALMTEKSSAKEVRSYELGPFLKQRYGALYDGRLLALRKMIRTRVGLGVGGAVLSGAGMGGAAALLIVFIGDHRISIAGAGAAVAALLVMGSQLQGLAGGIGQLYESALYIRDFNSFISLPRTTRPEIEELGPGPGPVEVNDLGFTYPSRDEPSLVGVNLRIEPGQVIALVGENGSGKTTLAKLLAGLYRPASGSIRWDGCDIESLSDAHIRERTVVLFQDFVEYFMSAADNIAMGDWRRAEDRSAVREAARRGGADGFLSQLPNGYDTLLGPQFVGGSDLSGGQWQRVALARAFFRNAELVILDEPTASLDPKAEAELFGSVRELFRGRSVVLITHRFGSARIADYIYVLGAGQIVEGGTHQELMTADGVYAELYRLQAATFGLGG